MDHLYFSMSPRFRCEESVDNNNNVAITSQKFNHSDEKVYSEAKNTSIFRSIREKRDIVNEFPRMELHIKTL